MYFEAALLGLPLGFTGIYGYSRFVLGRNLFRGAGEVVLLARKLPGPSGVWSGVIRIDPQKITQFFPDRFV